MVKKTQDLSKKTRSISIKQLRHLKFNITYVPKKYYIFNITYVTKNITYVTTKKFNITMSLKNNYFY